MNQPVGSDGTVGKALEILDQVAAFGRPVRFSELLEDSSYPKATVYRFLQTLTNQRMLSYDPDRQTYSMGIRLVRLAHSAWKQSSLAPIARPFVDALAAEVSETVHLAQMDSGQVLYVDKRNASQPVEMFSQAGKVGPGYCTGVGKAMMAFMEDDDLSIALTRQSYYAHTSTTITSVDALLAELEEIRKQGIAFDREEHEPGIICIATPILVDDKRVAGGLSITSTTERHSLKDLEDFKPALMAAAQNIATEAAFWLFPSQS